MRAGLTVSKSGRVTIVFPNSRPSGFKTGAPGCVTVIGIDIGKGVFHAFGSRARRYEGAEATSDFGVRPMNYRLLCSLSNARRKARPA